MRISKLAIILFVSLVVLQFLHPVNAQISVQRSEFGIGGNILSDSSFRLVGSAGQTIIGTANNSDYVSQSGYWYTAGIVLGLDEFPIPIPGRFELFQNYPNPFNPITNIRFAVPKLSHVKLEIFNILGQRVAILLDKKMGPGYQLIKFDASNLAGGFYFYRLVTDGFHSYKKMILMK